MRRERISWCLFDFANSAFNTIVITFVFPVFFAEVLVGEKARGDALWARSLVIAGVGTAILAPILGSVADRRGWRRELLVGLSLTTIACTYALFLPSGSWGPSAVWTAFVLVTVANIAFETAFVFYNSFLPNLGDQATVGRLSGIGWALGFLGGLLCLALGLGFVGVDGFGPWLSDADGFNVRATNLLVATWFLVFALPMFLFVREGRAADDGALVPGGLRALWRTLRELVTYPDLLRLFIARLFYNDGLMAIIGLASLYMAQTVGMETGEIMLCGIWLNVAAGLGALGFGYVDDRVGSKNTVIASLVMLIAGMAVAFGIPTEPAFWVAATLIGVAMGPNQSASRTLVARMIEPERSAAFYGLFALSGKATVWLGPAMFSLVRPHVEDQRIAFMPILGLLLIGFVLVLGVDEQRGIARAKQP